MDGKERFSFYEKYYYFELERKEKLITRLNLAMVIIIALGSALSAMLDKAPPPSDPQYGVLFWTFYYCCLVSGAAGLWSFWKTWQLGLSDKLFPDPVSFEEYRTQIEEYFSLYKENENDAETHLRNIATYNLTICTRSNIINNDIRNKHFNKMASMMALTFILAMLSFAFLSKYQWDLKSDSAKTAATSTPVSTLREG